MDCKDMAAYIDAAQKLGIPALIILGCALKGKDLMEGLAAIIAAFRGGKT
jgi:hypothetical protein